MQIALNETVTPHTPVPATRGTDPTGNPATNPLSNYQIIRRNGAVVPFEPNKIAIAMMKAFLAVHGTQGAASASVRETVDQLTQAVIRALVRSRPGGGTFHIEDVQDQVELGLMRGGHHEIARAYVLYRERRTQERARQNVQEAPKAPVLHVLDGGQRVALDVNQLKGLIESACAGLGADVKPDPIVAETMRNLYDGVPMDEVYKASILAARTLIEKDPDYTYATARLLLHTIFKEVLARDIAPADMKDAYADYFPGFIKKGVDNELLDEKLLQFDLKRLGAALKAERDLKFDYLGLQTLYDRYFLHVRKTRIELPQAFFMRVAMGLALNEIDREARAIEFYEVLSSFDFMSSTPTLFNAGTLRSQLSSCYLTTVPDDLDGIYESIKENALLSKFAGGLGNDWTRVRALGSHIKGTNGESQGVVPFLKVVNDTAVAVNQGGKRKGAVCTYLETWHLDIEEFLELRKNTGDDRRRTHDMNTANWIPDLFMRRVMEKGEWTLFSPSNVPDLHDLFGADFEKAYVAYEEKARRGEIKPSKTVPATDLWRKMLTMLFETGHPWITFKDACNVRSPQQHAGVVHSSNLCTEITLNTSDDRNRRLQPGLGQPAAAPEGRQGRPGQAQAHHHHGDAHAGQRDRHQLLRRQEGARLQPAPPPGGSGCHGLPGRAVRAAHSLRLAAGRGVRRPVHGSHLLPRLLGLDRAGPRARQVLQLQGFAVGQGHPAAGHPGHAGPGPWRLRGSGPVATLDWDALRKKIAADGMRNSNCVAIAPTATISNIIGVDASIEPCFGNLSVKSNLSGEFTVINHYLVRDLKRLGLWDDVMVMDLKHFDGSLRPIDRVPQEVKALYATAFEVETTWLVEAAARRQKWIDQAQSLNIYMAGVSGKKLDDTYKLAWLRGLKTTYYLRTISATHTEKSTVTSGRLNAVSSGGAAQGGMSALEAAAAAAQAQMNATPATDIKFCAIDDPTCEACQ
jgi:ribonucleoside-diphosphate reductase alpha chain